MASLEPLIVTTSQDPSAAVYQRAQSLATSLGAVLADRDGCSLAVLSHNFQVEQILVVSANKLIVHTPLGDYFFHLSMAELRIKNIAAGKDDHMATAMELNAGMSVLDCTLGLATDAIVASYIVGAGGRITGLENSRLLALIARLGLKEFCASNNEITAALRRITVIETDAAAYLTDLPPKAYDIVYFDPMFRRPVYASSNVKPMRCLADSRPVTTSAITEALRVARHRVVLKEARGSVEFSRLGFSKFIGGKHSSIQFGVMEVER